jgi:hypothetical protein
MGWRHSPSIRRHLIWGPGQPGSWWVVRHCERHFPVQNIAPVTFRDNQGPDIAGTRRQVNKIIDAVKSTVPREMWGDIADKLDLEQHPAALDAETEDFANPCNSPGRTTSFYPLAHPHGGQPRGAAGRDW